MESLPINIKLSTLKYTYIFQLCLLGNMCFRYKMN